MMPSAQTQALYAESKQRLSDRIQSNVNAVGSIARQIVRGSKSSEVRCDAIVIIRSYSFHDSFAVITGGDTKYG